MKKTISLLAVAMLATVFAAGCGGKEKCSDATNPKDCNNKEFFDKDKGDKGNCQWNPTDASKPEGAGTCVKKAS